MSNEEIRLRIFEAIYEIGGDWAKAQKEFAEEVYEWVTKDTSQKSLEANERVGTKKKR